MPTMRTAPSSLSFVESCSTNPPTQASDCHPAAKEAGGGTVFTLRQLIGLRDFYCRIEERYLRPLRRKHGSVVLAGRNGGSLCQNLEDLLVSRM
jgi:hypothetical protein